MLFLARLSCKDFSDTLHNAVSRSPETLRLHKTVPHYSAATVTQLLDSTGRNHFASWPLLSTCKLCIDSRVTALLSRGSLNPFTSHRSYMIKLAADETNTSHNEAFLSSRPSAEASKDPAHARGPGGQTVLLLPNSQQALGHYEGLT